MDSVLIIAAEASSSLYAQRLLELWKKTGRHVEAFGIGSREMEKLGFDCIGRSEEMAVVGIQEVVKVFPLIRRVYHELLAQAEKRKPKFALLMDYPEFNLKIAKDLKKRGITVIYYISPQIWAWRTGRIKTIRKVVDKMLVLLPFEEPFYKKHNVEVSFVGHPLLDELPELETEEQHRSHRERFGVAADEIVLGLMPGSRRSEIQHHLQIQLQAASLLVSRNPRIRPVLMVAPSLNREELRTALATVNFPIQIIQENPVSMIQLADVMLVASGTATLLVGLLAKPMVIMYRVNAFTAWIARKLVTKTAFFGLPNLVLNRLVVPELLQEEVTPERLALELSKMIDHPEERRKVSANLAELRTSLGKLGATDRVAEILSSYLSQPPAGLPVDHRQ